MYRNAREHLDLCAVECLTETGKVHVPEPTQVSHPLKLRRNPQACLYTPACSESSALYTSGKACSRKTALPPFPCNNSGLPRTVTIFCGGSLTAKSGFSDSTWKANCEGRGWWRSRTHWEGLMVVGAGLSSARDKTLAMFKG